MLASLPHDGASANFKFIYAGSIGSDDFFIREAAAWPLVEIAGPSVLKELLHAYQRGFDDGQDNDGFTAALLELPSLEPASTYAAAKNLARTSGEPMKGHAEWLLTFCDASSSGE